MDGRSALAQDHQRRAKHPRILLGGFLGGMHGVRRLKVLVAREIGALHVRTVGGPINIGKTGYTQFNGAARDPAATACSPRKWKPDWPAAS